MHFNSFFSALMNFVPLSDQMTDGIPRLAKILSIAITHELPLIEGTASIWTAHVVIQLNTKSQRFSELLRTDTKKMTKIVNSAVPKGRVSVAQTFQWESELMGLTGFALLFRHVFFRCHEGLISVSIRRIGIIH